jgi:hypothetical protein
MLKEIRTVKQPKKRLSRAKIKIAKKHLVNLQNEGLSLRQIARKLGNKITFQSLGRFIREKDYVPVSDDVRELLDLYADPNPYKGLPRWYKRIPEALGYWNDTRSKIRQMYDEAKREQIKRKAG